jgi:hypothetical protein
LTKTRVRLISAAKSKTARTNITYFTTTKNEKTCIISAFDTDRTGQLFANIHTATAVW